MLYQLSYVRAAARGTAAARPEQGAPLRSLYRTSHASSKSSRGERGKMPSGSP